MLTIDLYFTFASLAYSVTCSVTDEISFRNCSTSVVSGIINAKIKFANFNHFRCLRSARRFSLSLRMEKKKKKSGAENAKIRKEKLLKAAASSANQKSLLNSFQVSMYLENNNSIVETPENSFVVADHCGKYRVECSYIHS